MKVLTDELEDEILKSGPAQYFFHSEEDGEVVIEFETPIGVIEPGEKDWIDREWNPPIADAQGNPKLDKNGDPLQPWPKVEAKCIITCEARAPPMISSPGVYSFGGKKSSQLRSMIAAIRAEELDMDSLPGTRWSINRVGRWDWQIRYLGKAEEGNKPSTSAKTETKATKEPSADLSEIAGAFQQIKAKNPNVEKGLTKDELIPTISFITGISTNKVMSMWSKIVDEGILKQDGDKFFIE